MKKYLYANAVLFSLLVLAAVPAEAKRPKNFRLMWKKATVAEAPEESTATVQGPAHVMAGRWTPEVVAALG